MSYFCDIMANIYEWYSEDEPNGKRFVKSVHPTVLKKRFLELYMVTGHVGITCQILGMVRRTVYAWRKSDQEFHDNMIAADEITLGLLEDEVYRRAVHGIQKPVYQNGKLVGFVTEYSDTMLIKLLQARAPEKWREKLTDANGNKFEGKIEIKHVHTGLQLASSEEEIPGTRSAVQDIEFTEMPKIETKDDLLDKL